MNDNQNIISIIKRISRKYLPDSKIILFGSRARNENKIDSDYDFLIITNEILDIEKKREIKSKIRKELASYKIPIDILIQTEEEVDNKKDIPGHILKQITRDGMLI